MSIFETIDFDLAKELRREIMEFFEFTWPRIAFFLSDRVNDNFQLILVGLR